MEGHAGNALSNLPNGIGITWLSLEKMCWINIHISVIISIKQIKTWSNSSTNAVVKNKILYYDEENDDDDDDYDIIIIIHIMLIISSSIL